LEKYTWLYEVALEIAGETAIPLTQPVPKSSMASTIWLACTVISAVESG
jgi:hypothetical protein